jgi:hypothetical protein
MNAGGRRSSATGSNPAHIAQFTATVRIWSVFDESDADLEQTARMTNHQIGGATQLHSILKLLSNVYKKRRFYFNRFCRASTSMIPNSTLEGWSN